MKDVETRQRPERKVLGEDSGDSGSQKSARIPSSPWNLRCILHWEGAGPGTADLGDFKKDVNKDGNEENEGAEGAGPGNADVRGMKKTRI